VTLPKLSEVGLALTCPAVAAPVPERGIVRVAFAASEVTVTEPLALPVELGANLTVKFALCPAPSVKDELMPLSANPVPPIATFETETVVPPVFVIVPERDWLEPTVTLPKLSDVGLALSCPGVAVPVPDRASVRDGSEASDVIVTFPPAVPDEVGANLTLTVAVAPAANVRGVVIPLTVKPPPVIAT